MNACKRIYFTATMMLVLVAASAQWADGAAPEQENRVPAASVRYRTMQIDGVEVFYREAGPRDGPVVLLLHGFPTSSHMFRNLIPLLADRKNDKLFPEPGAHPYLRDLPDAELHLLDTGHFALEDKLEEMAPLIRNFLDRKVARH